MASGPRGSWQVKKFGGGRALAINTTTPPLLPTSQTLCSRSEQGHAPSPAQPDLGITMPLIQLYEELGLGHTPFPSEVRLRLSHPPYPPHSWATARLPRPPPCSWMGPCHAHSRCWIWATDTIWPTNRPGTAHQWKRLSTTMIANRAMLVTTHN